ncbi:hypothetical protein LUZ61_012656 [Rhynchospora tenuis]|uniref:Protein kinase domain-containing protein n=1 Tax=Rhynchospora tenuis TaxID=198213 RepID=A0AAD6A3I1_9POAL|nr:hypothetical protein LUZ61_012656 [Rhynchospora tenuis]
MIGVMVFVLFLLLIRKLGLEDDNDDRKSCAGSEEDPSRVNRALPSESKGKWEPRPNLEGGWSKVRTISASGGTSIYQALDSNGVIIAVKQLFLPDLKVCCNERRWYEERKFELANEISILSRLQHKNIVGYRGCYKTEETVDIWYEYIHGNSIKELYLEKEFDRSNIPAYTRQILDAIKYLHKNNIVHRDLSCSNILLDDKGVVKLAGFHFAQQIEGNTAVPRDKELDEWVKWAAPELLIPDGVSDVSRCLPSLIPEGLHCGPASDIWSLGCTVLEMATASVPYSGMPWWDAIVEVYDGKSPMLPKNLPNDCREFIETCLQFKPSNRPTASQLLCHPFIAKPKQD